MILLNMDAAYAFLVHPGSMARVSASGVGSWRIMIAARNRFQVGHQGVHHHNNRHCHADMARGAAPWPPL